MRRFFLCRASGKNIFHRNEALEIGVPLARDEISGCWRDLGPDGIFLGMYDPEVELLYNRYSLIHLFSRNIFSGTCS
jgi:hypothetical protein